MAPTPGRDGAGQRPQKRKPRGPGGRPSHYDPAFHPKVAAALARDGMTVKLIAKAMRLTQPTVKTWIKNHQEFAAALRGGRELADALVENALFTRAVGFEHDELNQKIEPRRNHDGKVEMVVTEIRKVRKKILPDIGAITLWLTNRRRDKWTIKPSEEAAPPDLAKLMFATSGQVAAVLPEGSVPAMPVDVYVKPKIETGKVEAGKGGAPIKPGKQRPA